MTTCAINYVKVTEALGGIIGLLNDRKADMKVVVVSGVCVPSLKAPRLDAMASLKSKFGEYCLSRVPRSVIVLTINMPMEKKTCEPFEL